ncbi:MAG: hypothetical protein ABFQ65_03895 [Nanoarchaeota archaeon]
MAKKEKMKTPDWILEGYDSEEEYEKKKGVKKEHHRRTTTGVASTSYEVPKLSPKESLQGAKKSGKTFKLRKCPKCGSDEVGVIVGEEVKGKWECRKCGWKGVDVKEDELSEDEFMKYLDEKGEETA